MQCYDRCLRMKNKSCSTKEKKMHCIIMAENNYATNTKFDEKHWHYSTWLIKNFLIENQEKYALPQKLHQKSRNMEKMTN